MPAIWMDVDIALSEVPVNLIALIDDTDFKTREESVTYDQAGMDLVWNFVTTGGAYTQTAVTPTTGGDYDWTNQGNGIYSIEIPASGGASINNDTEGFGWFTGFATGILPWTGPVIGFRAAGLNNILIDSAYSATRGLSGTALPDAAADAAGGIPISDAGGLNLDALNTNVNNIETDTNELQLDWTNGGRLDLILDELTTQGDTNESKLDTIDTVADAILVDTGTTLPATLSTIDGKIDTVDGIVDNILVDTGELQTDWTNGGRLDLLLDAILADTNELQTDDVPGLIAALNNISAADVVTAMKASTGWTAGGTYQLDKVIKIIIAAVAGDVQDDPVSGQNVKDAEDGTTDILDVTLDSSTPYRNVTVL